jgi:hypothetical protein
MTKRGARMKVLSACFASIILAGASLPRAQSAWTWRNPVPQGNTLRFVTASDSRLVAFGTHGAIATSDDGESWQSRVSGTFQDLNAGCWTGKRFVAVGQWQGGGGQAVILTSPDGVAWKSDSSQLASALTAVVWTGQQVVAVGGSGMTLTSPDGLAWIERRDTAMGWYSSLAWTGKLLVGVGTDDGGFISTSSDGVTWTRRGHFPDLSLWSVTWTGKLLVCLGTKPSAFGQETAVLTSPDGITWTDHSFKTRGSYYFQTAFRVGDKIVAIGDSAVISTDAVTWAPTPLRFSAPVLSVTNLRGKFVGVGYYGCILSSTDGLTWKESSSGRGPRLYAIAQSGGAYLTAGDSGGFFASKDGIAWIPLKGNLSAPVFGLARFKDLWVAAGRGGVWTSGDGSAWTLRSTPGEFHAVASNGKQLVAVGKAGAILSSPDGITWSKGVFDGDLSKDLTSVTWAGTDWIAVGDGDNIISSFNGISWHRSSTLPRASWEAFERLGGVVWTGSRLVVIGVVGLFVLRENGGGWINVGSSNPRVSTGGSFPITMSSIAWTGHRLVIVGQGNVRTSADGLQWTEFSNPSEDGLNAVTWTGSRLLAVGNNGTILDAAEDPLGIFTAPHALGRMPIRMCGSEIRFVIPGAPPRGWVRLSGPTGKSGVELPYREGLGGESSVRLDPAPPGLYILQVPAGPRIYREAFLLAP